MAINYLSPNCRAWGTEQAEYKTPTFSVTHNKMDILEKTPDVPEATRNHDEMTSDKPLSLEVNSESNGELKETEMTNLLYLDYEMFTLLF